MSNHPKTTPSEESFLPSHPSPELAQPPLTEVDQLSKTTKESVANLLADLNLPPSLQPEVPAFLNRMDPAYLSSHLENSITELNSKPKLKHLHEEIFQKDNFNLLRKKSRAQLQALKRHYYGLKSLLPWQFKAKKEKIKLFRNFVNSFQPIRSDAGANNFDEYLAPVHTGKINSYGPQDISVKAEKYVYASFDKLAHHMSQGRPTKIEESDISAKTQIVMMDVADLQARHPKEQFLSAYLNNTFDYATGKRNPRLLSRFHF